MKLNVYLAFVLDAQRKPHAGPLLATDAIHAMGRAIEQCKQTFGPRSKVSRIQQIAEADLPFMQRTEMLQMLAECDQVAFVAVEIDKLAGKTAELIQQLTSYVQALQAKLAGE